MIARLPITRRSWPWRLRVQRDADAVEIHDPSFRRCPVDTDCASTLDAGTEFLSAGLRACPRWVAARSGSEASGLTAPCTEANASSELVVAPRRSPGPQRSWAKPKIPSCALARSDARYSCFVSSSARTRARQSSASRPSGVQDICAGSPGCPDPALKKPGAIGGLRELSAPALPGGKRYHVIRRLVGIDRVEGDPAEGDAEPLPLGAQVAPHVLHLHGAVAKGMLFCSRISVRTLNGARSAPPRPGRRVLRLGPPGRVGGRCFR